MPRSYLHLERRREGTDSSNGRCPELGRATVVSMVRHLIKDPIYFLIYPYTVDHPHFDKSSF